MDHPYQTFRSLQVPKMKVLPFCKPHPYSLYLHLVPHSNVCQTVSAHGLFPNTKEEGTQPRLAVPDPLSRLPDTGGQLFARRPGRSSGHPAVSLLRDSKLLDHTKRGTQRWHPTLSTAFNRWLLAFLLVPYWRQYGLLSSSPSTLGANSQCQGRRHELPSCIHHHLLSFTLLVKPIKSGRSSAFICHRGWANTWFMGKMLGKPLGWGPLKIVNPNKK